jgi:hypothetical protein
MKSNFDKVMDGVNESRHHIYFWRAEYRKRKFMVEHPDKYKSFPSLIKDIYRDLNKLFSNFPNDRQRIGDDYYDKLQQSVFLEGFSDYKTPVFIGNFNVRNFFSRDNIPELIWKNIFDTCFFSFEYDYYISFLSSKCDMYGILKLLSEGKALPTPPETHFNKTQKDFIPSHLLKVLRIDRSGSEVDSLTKQILIEYNKQHPQFRGSSVLKSKSSINYDVAILADIFNEQFDIEKSINEIQEKLIYMIYDHKSRNKIDLNDREIELLRKLFDKFARGHTRSSHSHSRATGLWIWDYMYFNPNIKTQAKVYREFSQLDLKKYHDFDEKNESSRRTFDGIMVSTRKSIDEGEVLPIKR